METEKHYLYLLRSAVRPAFKIGITNNIVSRIQTLEMANKVDYSQSVVHTGCRRSVRGMERTLHYLFHEYRLKPWGNSDGKTEWFDVSCRSEVEMMIGRLSDRSGLLGPWPLPDIPERVVQQPTLVIQRGPRRRTISDVRLRGWTKRSNDMLQSLDLPAIDWATNFVPNVDIQKKLIALTKRSDQRSRVETKELLNIMNTANGHLYDIRSGLVDPQKNIAPLYT